jgi:rod shape-determining protein MreC
MESVLGRYRNLIILVGVLFLQVLGLAMQVKRNNDALQDTRLIRIWVVGAISPFERGLVWIRNSSGGLWHNYFYLRGVRAENRELKQQIEQMRLEQVRLTEDAAQAHRLQALLAFKEQYVAKTVAAQVIGSSGSDFSRIINIDKGENVGIRKDMAVITAEGIVGKVILVYPSVAQVLLISDQSSGVGALLEKSRLQGVLRGTATGEVGLEKVMSDQQVELGEKVLTSGGDQIFPKGLPVGTVSKVGSGKDLFLNIKITPAANLSRLEEVLVLLEKQERQATAEDNVRVRAADILAQRLPSVPDRPTADAKSVGAVTEAGARPASGGAGVGANTGAQATESATKPSTSGSGSSVRQPDTRKPSAQAAATQTPKVEGALTTSSKPKSPAKTQAAPEKPVTTEQKAPSKVPHPEPPASDNGPN